VGRADVSGGIIVMATLYGGGIVTNGLVLALDAGNPKSYLGSGTTWIDLSGNAINGTLTNGPTFDSGNGGSIVFDGVNDYVTMGTPSSLNITGNITIQSWVNLTNFPAADNIATIYEKGYDGTNEQTYFRFRKTSGNQSSIDCGTYSLSVNVDFRTTTILTGSNANLITTGQWNNLVGQYDGTNWNIYVNGVLTSTTTQNQAPLTSTSPASIGAAFISTGFSRFINGKISNTIVYNRALTPQEVQQNFNATRSRFGI
jgi:hypothetical protein